MIFDGKTFAASRREELLKARAAFGDISLGVVVSSDDPVTSSFVRIKEKNAEALGVRLVRYAVPKGASTEEVAALVEEATKENGVIVQLPLHQYIDVEGVLNAIPEEKDVDALSPAMVSHLMNGDLSVIPPVAAAVYAIVQRHRISVENKNVVVIGKGRLVGAPCAQLFRHLGAEVISVGKSDDAHDALLNADIVMLGAGSPHFLKPDMVKTGVVIFDAGTSEAGGVVVGDADPAVAEKASFFTPVPGGIGPVAVVEIFANLFKLLQNKNR